MLNLACTPGLVGCGGNVQHGGPVKLDLSQPISSQQARALTLHYTEFQFFLLLVVPGCYCDLTNHIDGLTSVGLETRIIGSVETGGSSPLPQGVVSSFTDY